MSSHHHALHGWIVLNKPIGLSSAQAVGRVRRLFGGVKAGHAGTLDPLADGVLPIALGEATKTISYAMSAEKSYRFGVRWGAETQTDDREGDITTRSEVRPAIDDITAVLSEFTGVIDQIPPVYSAVKLGGKRAYALARQHHKNQSEAMPELSPRQVIIHRLVLESADRDSAEFTVDTGKGVYVRSLARDLGRRLGTAAHVTMLRRLSVGCFDITQSISLDSLEKMEYDARSKKAVLPVRTVLDDIPALAVTAEQAEKLRHGQAVSLNHVSDDENIQVAYLDESPVAFIKTEMGCIVPVRVFNL